MLFNSYVFIFAFLPAVLAGFHIIGTRINAKSAMAWLVLCSLFFYGWWNPIYLFLMLASVLVNYSLGLKLANNPSKLLLAFGITLNLLVLAYFKYANFFVDSINATLQTSIHLEKIILPLAISFFTFQQIAYLVDTYRKKTNQHSFLDYCLFVTFFPQLIAGPIVHHKDMLPQFRNKLFGTLKAEHLTIGISIFILGLFKKVILADHAGMYATTIFEAADRGTALTFFEAWAGALSYSFQIYFDFSGYSDMAIGLARMFGIVLPINFYSPYKAGNIIEFWRRWHITLSNFLRDYLYIPLGGNRNGSFNRYKNLMLTMLIGGLWHGASWTFVIWGGLHGAFLIINHGWRGMPQYASLCTNFIFRYFGVLLTFTAVVIAWVIFRAENLETSMQIYSAMFGGNGISLPSFIGTSLGSQAEMLEKFGFSYQGMFSNELIGSRVLLLLSGMFLIVWLLPNTLDIFKGHNPALGFDQYSDKNKRSFITWEPKPLIALIVAFMATIAIMFIQKESEFLYFQF